MKITKPKDNQILIEDDIFKQFELKVKSNTGLNNSGYNKIYQGLILAYRLPDMDASKQLFYGDPISIMTLFCSCLESIVANGLISENNIDDMVEAVKEYIFNYYINKQKKKRR